MKGKYKTFLFASMLALCIGVMGFGIYAAMSASLNVTGNLGFTMHDCMIQIEGQVKNLAKANGESYTTYNMPIDKFVKGAEGSTTTNSLSLGDMYFYKGVDSNGVGKIFNIEFEMSYTNLNLSTTVLMEINATTLPTGVGIATDGAYVTLPFKTYLSAGQTKTVTFALSGDEETLTSSLSSLVIDMNFSEDDGTHSSLFSYEESTGWYTTMGTNPYSGYNEPLKWLPFAKYAGTAQVGTNATAYSYYNRTTAPVKSASYYLISEKALDVSDSNYGLLYNFKAYSDSSLTTNFAPYYDGSEWKSTTYDPNDYAISNVRAYLTANRTAFQGLNSDVLVEGAYSAFVGNNELTPFMEQFNISTSDPVYSQITARNQTSLYYDIKASTGTVDSSNSTTYGSDRTLTINGANLTITSSTSDKFWLTSYYETYNFLGNCKPDYSEEYLCKTLKGVSATYWLRSEQTTGARMMVSEGWFFSDDVRNDYAVRPAFQLIVTQ